MERITISTENGIITKPHPAHKEKTYKYTSKNFDYLFFKKHKWIEKVNNTRQFEYQIVLSYHNDSELNERIKEVELFFKTKLTEILIPLKNKKNGKNKN